MLDFGFSEIVLTSAIALVVLGPEKLPKVARQVGTWMGRARSMARQLSEQLEREVNAEELLRTQKKTAPPPPARPVTPEPTQFEPSAVPHPLPPDPAPQDVAATPPAAEAPVYTREPDQTPHGADWQPTPENKASNG